MPLGTLSSELHARSSSRLGDQPRVYADANIPTGVVEFMRERLGWDVLFVLEHDDDPARPRYRALSGWRGSSDARSSPSIATTSTIGVPAGRRRRRDRVLRAGRTMAAQLLQTGGPPAVPRGRRRALPLEGRKLQWHMGHADGDDRRTASVTEMPIDDPLCRRRLVLPDRVLSAGHGRPRGRSHLLASSRTSRRHSPCSRRSALTSSDHYVVPGFIDVHVHGVEGPTRSTARTRSATIAGTAAALWRDGLLSRPRLPALRWRCAACWPRSRAARATAPPALACCRRTWRATSSIPSSRRPAARVSPPADGAA